MYRFHTDLRRFKTFKKDFTKIAQRFQDFERFQRIQWFQTDFEDLEDLKTFTRISKILKYFRPSIFLTWFCLHKIYWIWLYPHFLFYRIFFKFVLIWRKHSVYFVQAKSFFCSWEIFNFFANDIIRYHRRVKDIFCTTF